MFDPVHQQTHLSVYQVARTPYQTLRAEIEHGHWAVSFVREGNVKTLTRGERRPAPSGAVMVHPPSLPYAEYAEAPGIHEWVVFECDVQPGLALFQLFPVAAVVPLAEPAAFSALFGLLLRAWEGPPSAFRDMRVSTLTLGMLAVVVEDWRAAGSLPRTPAPMTAQDRFSGLVVYLSQHLDRKIGRDEIAAFAHLQPNHLDRAFRQAYGVAPMQMLRDLRLQRARHLLESSDHTVGAIAVLCGFEEAGYFTRVFRRKTGQTPSEYRRDVSAARRSYDHAAEARQEA